MVRRLGIAAASASAVIFSILLASNLLVFAASQGRERMYLQADSADSLADNAEALMGAGGTNVLMEAQAALASTPLDCHSASGAVASIIGGLSDSQRSGDLFVNVSSSPYGGGTVGDNLSMLAPFGGSVSGEVDISLAMVASGNDSAAGVSLARSEVHLAHLPVRLGSLVADCLAAVSSISRAISAAGPPNCTRDALAPLVEGAGDAAATAAAADGFSFGLTFSAAAGASCTVSFAVTLGQRGIQGPEGPFSIQVRAEDSVSFSPEAPSPPA